MRLLRRVACRLFGHRRWYYTPDEFPDDLWWGCIRCKDPETVSDRVAAERIPGRPGYVYVNKDALQRLIGRLDAT